MLGQNTGYKPDYVGNGNGCVSGGTCYYIDFENGSDSNDGLAKTAGGSHGPWKSAPGMACASGKAASHSMSQTDEFILKGGVSWPRSCFEWVIGGGNADSPNNYAYPGMYVGYDPTWNKGVVSSVRVIDPGVGCSKVNVVITPASGDNGSGAAGTAHIDANVGLSGANVVSYVDVTNGGSNYGKNPVVSFTGTCTTFPTAVADITSPVLDGSGGVFGNAGSMPRQLTVTTKRLTLDHLEIAHMHFYSGSDYSCSHGSPNMIGAFGANQVLQNLYVHDFVMDGAATGQLSDCRNAAQSAALYADGGSSVQTLNNNIFNNYESEAHGCFNRDGVTCVQMTAVFNIKRNTNNVYNNWRGGLYTVAPLSDFLVAGNKMWAILHDPNTQHEDAYYLMSGGLFYNNILRDIFPGSAAFYIETGDGSNPTVGNISYMFNNVAWNIGTSTPPIGWSSEFTGQTGSVAPAPKFFAYNNTFYGTSGTMDCMNAGQWYAASPSLSLSAPYSFTLKNNFCVSTQGSAHWFNSNTSPSPCTNGCGVWNGMTQPNSGGTRAAIDPLNVILTPSNASAQGYTPSNNFAPTDSSDSTVTFANSGNSANLTDTCSNTLNGLSLAELCNDINGNPRPTTGGWEAGAYAFNSDPPPAPPSDLNANVH